MSTAANVVVSTSAGRLTCDLPILSGVDGFNKLWEYLQANWSAVLVSRADGPDASRWVFETRGVPLEMQFEDPWGTRLVSPASPSDPVLRDIAADLEARLRHV